jgi:hypothetical protein
MKTIITLRLIICYVTEYDMASFKTGSLFVMLQAIPAAAFPHEDRYQQA